MNRKKVLRTSYFVLRTSGKSRGFTLIEVLIYGFIFGAFLMLVTQLFLTIKSTTANSMAMSNLQQNYARIFSDFNQTIRSAENVTSPLPGNFASSLSLNDGQITYQLSDGVMQKTIGTSTYDLNDNGLRLTGINFENAVESTQTAVIKINFSVESNYFLQSGKKVTEDFQTTIGLR